MSSPANNLLAAAQGDSSGLTQPNAVQPSTPAPDQQPQQGDQILGVKNYLSNMLFGLTEKAKPDLGLMTLAQQQQIDDATQQKVAAIQQTNQTVQQAGQMVQQNEQIKQQQAMQSFMKILPSDAPIKQQMTDTLTGNPPSPQDSQNAQGGFMAGLKRFLYQGGQGAREAVGLPTDLQQQQQRAGIANTQAQTRLHNVQADQLGSQVTLPNGVTVPFALAQKLYPSLINQQTKITTTGMNNATSTANTQSRITAQQQAAQLKRDLDSGKVSHIVDEENPDTGTVQKHAYGPHNEDLGFYDRSVVLGAQQKGSLVGHVIDTANGPTTIYTRNTSGPILPNLNQPIPPPDQVQPQAPSQMSGKAAFTRRMPQGSAANPLPTAQVQKAQEYNSNQIENIAKPVDQAVQRMGRLQDTLNQNSPQADALVAPELLTTMAGGQGSGLRMNEAEISRIVGGKDKWQQLQSKIMAYQTDPTKPFEITPEQRVQIRSLISAVSSKLTAKQQTLNEARQSLLTTQDYNGQRKILADTRAKMDAIDLGQTVEEPTAADMLKKYPPVKK